MEQVQKEIELERAKQIVENARAEEESRLAYLRRAIQVNQSKLKEG